MITCEGGVFQVFTADPRLVQQLTPHLRRVLVVEAGSAAQRLLGELLRSLGANDISTVATTSAALELIQKMDPQIIFTELTGDGLDGLRLAKEIRRSELACRRAPIIMMTAEATPNSIYGARDAGVHEFLRKPYTIRDLLRRLEAVTGQKRDWIEGIAYIGPDRRRFNSGDYQGPRKRKGDGAEGSPAARQLQAMKIVQAAYAALGSDPRQAHRALCAQAETIQTTALETGDPKLAAAAAALTGYLIQAGPEGLVTEAIAVHLRTLWSRLPEGMADEARSDRAAA